MAAPNPYLAAVKAIAAGSLAGSALPSIFTVIVGIGMMANGSEEGLLVAFIPFMITLACASVGFVVVVLPLTSLLKRRQAESGNAYSLYSGLLGGGLPLLASFAIAQSMSGVFLGLFGLMTGASVGHFWWRWGRQPVVETTDADTAAVFE